MIKKKNNIKNWKCLLITFFWIQSRFQNCPCFFFFSSNDSFDFYPFEIYKKKIPEKHENRNFLEKYFKNKNLRISEFNFKRILEFSFT